jgi:lipopolysaccharide/colanic/teichoic acid biosynthesis glycosyltransferase
MSYSVAIVKKALVSEYFDLNREWDGKALFKRAFDFFSSGLALLVLAPFFLLVAALIRIESKGKAIYTQTRVGRNGETFTMYKFRSMYVDAVSVEELSTTLEADRKGVCVKFKKDPRVTRIGRIIRKLSIDELPQLINVFLGDMSVVGPRPALESEVAKYNMQQMKRLNALPGITGLWQVSGRADLDFEKQVLLDIEYIEKSSFFYDLKLILMTVPAVVLCRGAY